MDDIERLNKVPLLKQFSKIERVYGQGDNKKSKLFLKCDETFLTINFLKRSKIKRLLKTYKFLLKEGFDYVPQILWCNKRKNILVTSFPGNGNGKSLEEISEKKIKTPATAIDQVYELMEKLHKIEVPSKYEKSNWYEMISKEITGYITYFKRRKLLSKVSCQKIFDLLVDLKPYFEKVKLAYIHDDLTGKNICYDIKLNQAYFIDWDTLKIGDPNIDLAKTITHKYSPIMEEMAKKYYPNLDPRIIHFYHIRVYLYWLKFLYKNKNAAFAEGLENFKIMLNKKGNINE